MRARTLDEHLKANEAMARVAAHAGHLQGLQRLFEKAVPATLMRTCRVANFKMGVLVIHAANGAAAAKLRQIAPSLSEMLRSKGEQVTEIRIKVQPFDIAEQHVQVQAAVLGEASRARIDRLSASLPEGPLRASLEELVKKSIPRR